MFIMPPAGSRLVIGRFAKGFGHIDYRSDGRMAVETARTP